MGLQGANGSVPGESEGDLVILFSQQVVSGELQLAGSSASRDLTRTSLVTILGLDAGEELEVMAVSRSSSCSQSFSAPARQLRMELATAKTR